VRDRELEGRGPGVAMESAEERCKIPTEHYLSGAKEQGEDWK
jgi:hypothetical protein